jgi:hypothetical protein
MDGISIADLCIGTVQISQVQSAGNRCLTRFRQQAGLGTDLDVQQAVANVETTRAQIASLESHSAQTAHAIAVLLDQLPPRSSGGTGRAQADSCCTNYGRWAYPPRRSGVVPTCAARSDSSRRSYKSLAEVVGRLERWSRPEASSVTMNEDEGSDPL